jgi:ATP-binding cassette subfamily B protein RaxB
MKVDTAKERIGMGYETLVGDMASWLSGGQKQRVLLARLPVQRAARAGHGQATSALDVALERAVNEAISALNISRIILIANQPETIASAGRVIVLRGGSVAYDAPQLTAATCAGQGITE